MLNSSIINLTCLRCGVSYEVDDYLTGCPKCLNHGFPSSLKINYDNDHSWRIDQNKLDLRRFDERLPYSDFPTMGEGRTPLLSLKSNLWLKNEGQNPTGSHKDRMSPFIVARAKDIGKKTVVAASSGNAGLSLAAYAAFSELKSVVIATDSMNLRIRDALNLYGSQLIITRTSLERWKILRELVEKQSFYPATNYLIPPVGSNLFGVQGYKTIAYELYEQMPMPPTHLVIPTSRADLLWGIWEGFKDLYTSKFIHELPKMIAVEPIPRLSKVLLGADYRNFYEGTTKQTSIAGNTVTFQGVSAIQESFGEVIVIDDYSATLAQKQLAEKGFYLEKSSAAGFSAVQILMEKKGISYNDQVVLIGTSNGFKGL